MNCTVFRAVRRGGKCQLAATSGGQKKALKHGQKCSSPARPKTGFAEQLGRASGAIRFVPDWVPQAARVRGAPKGREDATGARSGSAISRWRHCRADGRRDCHGGNASTAARRDGPMKPVGEVRVDLGRARFPWRGGENVQAQKKPGLSGELRPGRGGSLAEEGRRCGCFDLRRPAAAWLNGRPSSIAGVSCIRLGSLVLSQLDSNRRHIVPGAIGRP